MYKIIFFLVALILSGLIGKQEATAQQRKTRMVVQPATCFLDGNSSPYNELQPGDTLFFLGGSKQYLQLKNFHGSDKLPIVFMNLNGMVTFNTTFHYGIKIANCRYIRLTGTGDPKYFYGFMVQKCTGGAGISVGELSSDFEVDHVYISNTPIAGVYAKTDPDCSLTSVRSNFTQYNTSFHDNYITNVGNEGFYIGSSFYSGETMNCNGKDTLLLPSVLKGVRVYNNIVKYTGWDGIQVGSATTDCMIYNNLVMYDSQAGVDFQMSGILIGGGSNCDCYNNYIYNGKGDGVESLGLGNYRIFNNVIVGAGYNYYPANPERMKYGIYIADVSTLPGASYNVLFNDIINPKTNGIRFASVLSRKNLIASNVIINPGAGSSGYIVLTNPGCEVLQKNNYLAMTPVNAGFFDTTFMLKSTSPLIDAGYTDNKKVTFDYFNHPRLYGKGYDIGINEYNPEFPPLKKGSVRNEHSPDSDSAISLAKKSLLRIDLLPFPNPSTTKISMTYSIDSAFDVFLDIYNYDGLQIRHIEKKGMLPGYHVIDLDISDYPEGVNLFTLHAGKESVSGKFVKIKKE